MERFKQKLLQAGIPFRENEPLAAHCTFKIGGPAQLFVQPQTEQQLCSAAALCKEQAVRYYLLGNGSNILFADEGFAGVVIDISALGSDIAVEGLRWNTACPVWNLPTASPARWAVQCI